MLEKLSIQKKMNYLIGVVTVSLAGVALFVFTTMGLIEDKYEHLLHTVKVPKY